MDSEASCEGISRFWCRCVFSPREIYMLGVHHWFCSSGCFDTACKQTAMILQCKWLIKFTSKFPGSGIVLIIMLITTSDLILCRRRFLRLLMRAVLKNACFQFFFCQALVSGGWKWFCLMLSHTVFLSQLNYLSGEVAQVRQVTPGKIRPVRSRAQRG